MRFSAGKAKDSLVPCAGEPQKGTHLLPRPVGPPPPNVSPALPSVCENRRKTAGPLRFALVGMTKGRELASG
jgi:hypothetical protein